MTLDDSSDGMQQQQRRLQQPRGDSSAYPEWAPGRPGLATRGVQAGVYKLTSLHEASTSARATGRGFVLPMGGFPRRPR